MVIKVNNYCFFNKREIGSLRKMQRKFGVKKDSYAGNIIKRLYYEFFGQACSVKSYYRKYYRKEYSSCEEFLNCRFAISPELANIIVKEKLWFSNMKSKRDSISIYLNYENSLRDIFVKYVGGITYEN